MSTLANRDWWTLDAHGKPMKVRCLSQNYVLGTARCVTDDGVFGVVDARDLHFDAEGALRGKPAAQPERIEE